MPRRSRSHAPRGAAPEQPVAKPVVTAWRRPAVELRSGDFLIRSLMPGDASDTWLGWIADAELMALMNMPARRLTLSQLEAHIAGFDNRSRHVLGLFDMAQDKLIGIVVMDINEPHSSARFNMFIGDRSYWGDARLHPLGRSFLDYLFTRKGIEKVRCQVAADNYRMIGAAKLMGLRVEGLLHGEIKSFRDKSRIDQFVFGLLKKDWQDRRNT